MGEGEDLSRKLARLVDDLAERLSLSSVILIGSRSRGEELESSDADLVVVSNDFEGMPLLNRMRLVGENWMPPPSLEVFPHTEREVVERSNTLTLHILEALDRGVILHDNGFFRRLREKFREKMRQGRIIRYRYGYAFTTGGREMNP